MSKKFTRRQFLKTSAAAAAGAAIAPHLSFVPGTNVAYAAGPSDAIVVLVQLDGGNDGLNTVYPLTGTQRTLYDEYRPTLAVPSTNGGITSMFDNNGFSTEGTVYDIGTNADGENYALHPAMQGLHDLYQAGNCAVLNGVHYPHPNHSHFRSEVIWFSGDPLGIGSAGWFGNYLNYAGYGATEVPVVNMRTTINPVWLPTNTSIFAFGNLANLRFPAKGERVLKQDKFLDLYEQASMVDPGFYPELKKIGDTGVATIGKVNEYYDPTSAFGKVEALLVDSLGRYSSRNPLAYDSPLNANYPDENRRLVRDMRHVAATIRADVGARYFLVRTGGFDSHGSQEKGFFHSNLLREISEGIAGLYNDLASDVSASMPAGYTGYLTGPQSPRVIIATISEFGRTMRQNAVTAGAAGTDHATSACQFVVGDAVVGGQYGAHPQLNDPRPTNEDDMKMVYDLRDVYGTIFERWLNVPSGDIAGAGKIFPTTPDVDVDGNNYTGYTPIPFLPV